MLIPWFFIVLGNLKSNRKHIGLVQLKTSKFVVFIEGEELVVEVISFDDFKGAESSQNRTKLTEADVVLIKAKFGYDTVKVQLLVSSGIGKLKEEVGKRFNLMNPSFKLYYFDEDEWILLACDDDLQLCMKTLIASGKTSIHIMVKSMCN
ncbi:protein NLP8 [Sesamum alatum]|uniref:Protein NLP8 n=1 Tax=Sesamum alatum TaxID=300844 RepID=A0AAE1YU91_9LAMI|nr:protein NLP8 [Sesamum alatum]